MVGRRWCLACTRVDFPFPSKVPERGAQSYRGTKVRAMSVSEAEIDGYARETQNSSYKKDVFAACNCWGNATLLYMNPTGGQLNTCVTCKATYVEQAVEKEKLIESLKVNLRKQVAVKDASKAGSSSGTMSPKKFIEHANWNAYSTRDKVGATAWNVVKNFNSYILPIFDNDETMWTKHTVLGSDPSFVIDDVIKIYENDAKLTNGPGGVEWKNFKTEMLDFFRKEKDPQVCIDKVAELVQYFAP